MKLSYFKIIFLFLCFCTSLQAQVKGIVIDSISGKPLSNIFIYFDNSDVREITDEKGVFWIKSMIGLNQVTFSAVDYVKKVVLLEKNGELVIIMLAPKVIQLNEIVVKKGKKQKYSRKNNPAVDLMQKVIDSKTTREMEENENYQFCKSQKFTLALDDVTNEKLRQGIFKTMPFLKNNVIISKETGRQILPLTTLDEFSRIIYSKKRNSKKSIILDTQSKGISKLFSSRKVLSTIFKDYFSDINIYNNDIRLFQSHFISPISTRSALSFYKYFILDTVKIDTQYECIHLAFYPQNAQDFGFKGDLYVLNDSSYAVIRCLMDLPKSSGVNFIENLKIMQDYERSTEGKWLLKSDNMITQIYLDKSLQKLQLQRKTSYGGYSFQPIPDSEFKKVDAVETESLSESGDSLYLAQSMTLSNAKMPMDLFMDSLEQTRGFGLIMFSSRLLAENLIGFGIKNYKSTVDFGPVTSLISQNYIDGLRLRAGLQTTALFNPQLFLKGYYAYGFKDQRSKYMAKAEYSFNTKKYVPDEYPKNSLSVSYQYDVFSPMDKYLNTDKDNLFVSLKTSAVDQMSYIRSTRLKYELEPTVGLMTSAELNVSNDEPAGNLFYIRNDETNAFVHDISTSQATFTLEYAPDKNFIASKKGRVSISKDFYALSLSHSSGLKGLLGSDYSSNLTQLGFKKRFWFTSWGKMDLSLKAGAQWNKVPFPLLIMPAANASYYTQNGTFNLIQNMEFLNDRFASIDILYDFNGKIFNRIPLLKKLEWREIIRFKSLNGYLTNKNNPLRNAGDRDLFLFPMRNGHQTNILMDPKNPYIEMSVGVHNIFKFLQVEYVRRLTYLDALNVKKQGLRFSFVFMF